MSTEADTPFRSWSPLQTFAVFAWPLLVAVGVVHFFGLRLSGADELLAGRPPIAVLPIADIVATTPPANANATLESIKEVARKLRAKGYVVLDSSIVYAYPADVEVDPTLISKGATK